jgi:hypothetical protein
MEPPTKSFGSKASPRCLKTMPEGPHVNKWDKTMNVDVKELRENLKSAFG